MRLALEVSQQGTWSLDPATELLTCDPRMFRIWGQESESAVIPLGEVMERIFPEDREAVEKSLRGAMAVGGDGVFSSSYRFKGMDGRMHWVEVLGQGYFEDGTLVEMFGTARDATDEKRMESVLLAQKGLLERIARGGDLGEVLERIVRIIEEQSGDTVVASIMLVDVAEKCLRNGAACSLPAAYLEAIDGVMISPVVGTCAASAALNKVVLTSDIENDPKWEGLRHLPLDLGLKAAWSMPIRGSNGEVLGTIGTYFRERRGPDERDVQLVGMLAETAALALERLEVNVRLGEASSEILRRQRLYEAVVSNTPDLVYVFDLDYRFTYVNAALLKLWGKTWGESVGRTCLELGYEPWHAEMHAREIDEVVETKKVVKGEVSFKGRIFEYIFTPVIGVDGAVEAVSGTTRDVTDRKMAEQRAMLLAGLTRQMSGLRTEAEVVALAAKVTGEFLDVERCYFVECFEKDNKILIGPNWRRDDSVADLEGELNLYDFGGADWWRQYSAGNFAVSDVREDPLTREKIASYEAVGIRAYAVQPFARDGGAVVVLGVTDSEAREWTREEMLLIESVVSRTWPLVERIRSEAELRTSEEHLRLITNHIPALISYMDRDCNYRFTNDYYSKFFDTEKDSLIGKHAREVLGERIFQDRMPMIEQVLAGEALRIEAPAVHHQKGRRELDLALIPDRSEEGGVRGFYVMGFDITELKRSNESLASRGERLRLLWESARILLTTDDMETMMHRLFEEVGGHIGADTFFNFSVAEGGKSLHLRSWHGISAEEAEEVSRLELGAGPCGQVAALRKPVVIPNPEGDAVRDCELRFGSRAYAGFPLISEGQLLGTMAFSSKTRDAFTAEELEFIETISHYVTAAYVRLELVANLREGDKRKDEFLATLAHELRNPLAPIRTGIEVLKHSKNDPSKINGVIGIIERQTAQMVRLIDDLIDVSRITRGKIELRRSVIDLLEVLPGAVEAVQPLIDRSGHVLTTQLPERAVPVDGDAGRLAQVFANLLNNAARYTPDGGKIELRVEVAGGEVHVSVHDNGEGIDPAMQDRIFEMFTQVKRPGTSSSEGLGIGLTLVQLLVGKHGGKIQVFSKGAGSGSEFRVTLPLAVEVEHSGADVEEMSGVAHQPCRILVVDDGVSAADMLALFFKLEGYETATAYDGMEALEMAEKLRPRIVFLDIGMPRMDGYEAARKMREIPGCKDAILIALTGWGQESDREKTKQAGFDHHLVKPVEPGMLRQILAKLDLNKG